MYKRCVIVLVLAFIALAGRFTCCCDPDSIAPVAHKPTTDGPDTSGLKVNLQGGGSPLVVGRSEEVTLTLSTPSDYTYELIGDLSGFKEDFPTSPVAFTGHTAVFTLTPQVALQGKTCSLQVVIQSTAAPETKATRNFEISVAPIEVTPNPARVRLAHLADLATSVAYTISSVEGDVEFFINDVNVRNQKGEEYSGCKLTIDGKAYTGSPLPVAKIFTIAVEFDPASVVDDTYRIVCSLCDAQGGSIVPQIAAEITVQGPDIERIARDIQAEAASGNKPWQDVLLAKKEFSPTKQVSVCKEVLKGFSRECFSEKRKWNSFPLSQEWKGYNDYILSTVCTALETEIIPMLALFFNSEVLAEVPYVDSLVNSLVMIILMQVDCSPDILASNFRLFLDCVNDKVLVQIPDSAAWWKGVVIQVVRSSFIEDLNLSFFLGFIKDEIQIPASAAWWKDVVIQVGSSWFTEATFRFLLGFIKDKIQIPDSAAWWKDVVIQVVRSSFIEDLNLSFFLGFIKDEIQIPDSAAWWQDVVKKIVSCGDTRPANFKVLLEFLEDLSGQEMLAALEASLDNVKKNELKYLLEAAKSRAAAN